MVFRTKGRFGRTVLGRTEEPNGPASARCQSVSGGRRLEDGPRRRKVPGGGRSSCGDGHVKDAALQLFMKMRPLRLDRKKK